ncbi:af2f0c33-b0e7-4cf1-b0f3-e47ddfca5b93 [Sclerotinia trifoliorum]|uniref:Af2f0c33-b0e7-4cf1-b0f3-e47ddfca5b93 n=1 Tax=Sclerotinia trifoliorum TaxID=28548 RepID=A0A8H2ZPX1_9HELO|nr:af2f0c33-b0e7-4cf1-b0f3-e47ddfca5b93 [Sclerotinia trifoliorum]
MSSFTVPTDVTAPDMRKTSDASDENSVTVINMRNRAILYESNHPDHIFQPSVLNLPNDEASEARFFTRVSERKNSTTAAVLNGAADAREHSISECTSQAPGPSSQTPENPTEQQETTTAEPRPPVFFRCCQCQHTSLPPTCQRKAEEIGIFQTKDQRVLVVNTECAHAQCMRCVNVDENGVRIGFKPWELEWRDPAISRGV